MFACEIGIGALAFDDNPIPPSGARPVAHELESASLGFPRPSCSPKATLPATACLFTSVEGRQIRQRGVHNSLVSKALLRIGYLAAAE